MSQFDEFNERLERTKAKADAHRPVTTHQDRDLGFRWKFLEAFLDVFGWLFAGALGWIIIGGAVVAGIAVTLGVSLKFAFGIAVVALIAGLAFAAAS